MIDIRTALLNFLKDSSSISAIVEDKIFPGFVTTKRKLPYIVFQQISGPGEHHMGGASEIAKPTFQIDCYGRSSPEAFDVSEAVRNSIVGLRGFLDNVQVSAVFFDAESESIDPPDDASENPTFRMRLDLKIWYKRPVPTFF